MTAIAIKKAWEATLEVKYLSIYTLRNIFSLASY